MFVLFALTMFQTRGSNLFAQDSGELFGMDLLTKLMAKLHCSNNSEPD